MVNLLLNDRAVDVVGPKTQGNLSDLGRHHLPVSLDVWKIIEHQAAHGDLLDVQHARGLRQMLQRGVVGMESQWDKRLKATGLILQRAQLEQMVDAIFVVLHVAVKHGGVGFQPDLVSQFRSLQPLVAIDLVITDDMAHALSENFCPTTRKGIHARGFQLRQCLASRKLGALR